MKLPLTNTHISLFVTVFTPPTPAGNHRYSQYFAPSTQQVIKSASQIEGPALIFLPEISRSQSDIFTTRMMPSELQTNKKTQFYCVSKCARRPRIVLAHEQLFTQLAGAGAQAQITSTQERKVLNGAGFCTVCACGFGGFVFSPVRLPTHHLSPWPR